MGDPIYSAPAPLIDEQMAEYGYYCICGPVHEDDACPEHGSD